MRLLTLLPAIGLVGQALSSPFSCDRDPMETTLAELDAEVRDYFGKLGPVTRKTLLHDTTGPEAGADVSQDSRCVLSERFAKLIVILAVQKL
jgi:hypothetical protein